MGPSSDMERANPFDLERGIDATNAAREATLPSLDERSPSVRVTASGPTALGLLNPRLGLLFDLVG